MSWKPSRIVWPGVLAVLGVVAGLALAPALRDPEPTPVVQPTPSNVYVISLGAEDGVKPGFQYTVQRTRDAKPK